MSDIKTYKDQSRRNWHNKDYQNTATNEQLQIGCLQRIADATEAMAKNYTSLMADRDWYKKRFYEADERRQALERKISALKGVITKMKNRNHDQRPI